VKHERFTTADADDLHIRSLLGPVSRTDLSSTLGHEGALRCSDSCVALQRA